MYLFNDESWSVMEERRDIQVKLALVNAFFYILSENTRG